MKTQSTKRFESIINHIYLRVLSFCKEIVDENKKVLEFLAEWIVHHTFEEDQDYKKYL